jgi:hypothetical protein
MQGRELEMLRSESRERRPKWHLLYYVLAAIAVLTICGSLYLNHAVRLIHQDSVAVNQEWAEQHSNLLELANLAQAVNAPGNDIFDSRDADQEQARHEQALAIFEAKLVQIRQELFSKPRTAEVRSLIASPTSRRRRRATTPPWTTPSAKSCTRSARPSMSSGRSSRTSSARSSATPPGSAASSI